MFDAGRQSTKTITADQSTMAPSGDPKRQAVLLRRRTYNAAKGSWNSWVDLYHRPTEQSPSSSQQQITYNYGRGGYLCLYPNAIGPEQRASRARPATIIRFAPRRRRSLEPAPDRSRSSVSVGTRGARSLGAGPEDPSRRLRTSIGVDGPLRGTLATNTPRTLGTRSIQQLRPPFGGFSRGNRHLAPWGSRVVALLRPTDPYARC